MNYQELSLDLNTLRNGYLAGTLDPVEVLRECLRRIEAGDSATWITLENEEKLLQAAEKLKKEFPQTLPLYGIPFAVKDNIDVADLPTTAACPDYKRFATEDATVVANLRAAGAIPVGKTNLDQFATGLVGVRSPYGAPDNTFKPEYISGGSSSGSATSVASGQVSFSLGTDTAGSGRVPACFNNLVGLKPSKGLLSTNGVVPACKSLDCVSIFSLNAGDAQTIFHIAESYDTQDPFSRRFPTHLRNVHSVTRSSMSFGVPEPSQLQFFGNQAYMDAYLKAIDALERLGYAKVIVDLQPFLEAARLLYEGPWVAERYWATRDIIENSPDSLHPVTRSIIEKGNQSTAVDAFDAFYKLQALRSRSEPAWNDVDFLAIPTAGTCYTKDAVAADPVQTNSNLGYYTNFMNLLDLSAVAAPTALTGDGLPFGITLVAPAFHDDKLLQVADVIQRDNGLNLGATEHRVFAPLKPAEFKTKAIAVCGAHMEGLPLNHQLTDRGATLEGSYQTAAAYKLIALPNTTPPKPGMIRQKTGGKSIALEVWELPEAQWASFIEGIPSPLGIGSVELEDGTHVHGFMCEGYAAEDALDVSEYRSWRNYLASLPS